MEKKYIIVRVWEHAPEVTTEANGMIMNIEQAMGYLRTLRDANPKNKYALCVLQ